MTTQEEVRKLVETNGIHLTWIAEKLSIKKSTLKYILYESPKQDDALLEQIKELIESFQFELNLFEDADDDPDLFSEEELHMGIGERIRLFAKRKYGTLKKLADAMLISPQQLQQYISGKREPGSRILIKLLKLGCDINWLLGGKERAESYRVYKLETELRTLQHNLKQIVQITNKLEKHL
ncbi:MAG: helix-turn-helix domain-containing protein [Bacteroidetes bacterium]|nr:helix-turn-helix domain-containing protein [Bacteroidota bacterium]